MSKFKQQYKTMLEDNELIFEEFTLLHAKYASGDTEKKEKFDEVGQKILRIIRRYEDMLCARSEKSGFGRYSENLSDKFWEEVRIHFPRIDDVSLE